LVPVLEGIHVAEPVPSPAVYPTGRHRMPRVRAFLEFLVETYGHAPWYGGCRRPAAGMGELPRPGPAPDNRTAEELTTIADRDRELDADTPGYLFSRKSKMPFLGEAPLVALR